MLDAVDDVDRRRVERLLETSPEARAEVERLNVAADQLAEAAAAGASAPTELFGSLMAKVAAGGRRAPVRGGGRPDAAPGGRAADRAPPPRPRAGRLDPGPPDADTPAGVASFERHAEARRSRAPWILSAAAVVVLFVVGAVVVGNRSDDGVTDSVAAMEQMAAEAASMPGARTGALTDAGNTMAVQVVVDPDGHAFVMSGVLPPLDSDHTYQLWSAEGGTMVSLGLLGSDADDVGRRRRPERARAGHHHRARRRQPGPHRGPDGERHPQHRLSAVAARRPSLSRASGAGVRIGDEGLAGAPGKR